MRIDFHTFEGKNFPLVITPQAGYDVSTLGPWLKKADDQKKWLKEKLLEHGALLFRGFDIHNATAMHAFCDAIDAQLMDYPRGTSPRNEVGQQIYTSTEVPHNLPLPIHTEMSYTAVFPRALGFCCVIPPREGGETPLADMKNVLARLPKNVVDAFEQKGILYHQYCPSGHNNTKFKTWQDMFGTEQRAVAEQKCAAQDVKIGWLKDGSAKLTNFGSAIRQHPVTGERIWFNQAHVFHPTMSAEFRYIGRPAMAKVVRVYEWLLETFPSIMPPYPYGCTFGDGSTIPRDYILAVRQAIWDETVKFPWKKGDFLLVDNLRLGHGRMPFTGERKILAALIKGL
jgi:alpha-ketoglutarate-dependent taurine dioxygenase